MAVQLLERLGELSFASLKTMAEQMEGTFNFTLLDEQDNLYIVKGNNPLCLYHWSNRGLYLYASTEGILKRAIQRMPISLGQPEEILLAPGDMLCIHPDGACTAGHFSVERLYPRYWTSYFLPWEKAEEDQYVAELKSVAGAFGFTPGEIDQLLVEGITPEEIEDYFYFGAV